MRLLCRGSGDPILFVHGIPTSHRLWDGIVRRLCPRYTCYLLDLPGLGEEPRIDCALGQLRRIAGEIDRLRAKEGIERWHVVGHDAGAAVSVTYAHAFPQHVDRLALLSPALFADIRPYYLFQLLRKRVLGELLAPCIHPIIWKVAMRRACAGGDDDSHLALAAFQAPFRGARGPWNMMRLLRWGCPEEVLGAMPSVLTTLPLPTIIFHGANDPAIPLHFAQRTASLIPDAKLIVVEGGHFVPLVCPEEVARGLDTFFNNGCRPLSTAFASPMALNTAVMHSEPRA